MTIKRLIYNEQGKAEWIEIDSLAKSKPFKYDPTIDQIISKEGGILNHADNKIYFSKRSYLDAIKKSGCILEKE